MKLTEIAVNNCKCKIIFLITGMRHTTDKKAIPREYIDEVRQLIKKLQTYVSHKEYISFLSEALEIPLQSAVEEAEDILENLYKNRGLDNGN